MQDQITAFQVRHRYALLGIFMLLLGLFVFYGMQLKVDPSLEVLVPSDSEYNTNNVIVTNAFGQRDVMTVLTTLDSESVVSNRPRTVTGPAMDAYYDRVQETLLDSQYVDSVGEPEISPDRKKSAMDVRVRVPDNTEGFEAVTTELNTLLEEVGPPPGVQSNIAGFPLLLNRVISLLIQDSLRTILIAFSMIIIILYFYFKGMRLTLLTVAVPLTSLIFLAGMMALFGVNVNITLAAIGVFILGLGVDYSIHISIHYQNERKQGKEVMEALQSTFRDLMIPITASFLTTLAGFSALMLGVSPSSQLQGFVLSVGIIVIYFISLFVTPLLLSIFGRHLPIRHNETFDAAVQLLIRLAIFQAHRPKTVLLVIGVLTLVMFGGAAQVQFSTSNSNWIPDEDPISEGYREIIWTYSNTDALQLIITARSGDLRDPFVVRDIQKLSAQLRNIPTVDVVQSAFDDLSLEPADIHQTLTYDRSDAFNPDFTLTTINMRSEFLAVDDQDKSLVTKEIRQILQTQPVHNTDVTLYGDVVRFDELSDSLQQDAGITTIIGLSLVFLVASALYVSVVVGIAALIPIVIAVIWAVGMMGYFNVPFTSLSTGIVSLVLGVGSDFSIHLVDGIKRYVKRGLKLDEAITKTLLTSGSAIMLTSVTTLFGFVALTGATLLGTQRLGLSLAFAIVSVFIVTVSMVPAIMKLYLGKSFKAEGK